MSFAATISPIETERMILRGPRAEDAPAFAGFYGSDRSVHAGGPATKTQAWNFLAADYGHWVMRGFGRFILTLKGSDRAIGLGGPYQPGTWPEREIGWVLFDGADEGKGLAREAAEAFLAHAFGPLGWDTAVSYIAPENARSIALAERLGARLDPEARTPKPGVETLVYRHPHPGGSA